MSIEIITVLVVGAVIVLTIVAILFLKTKLVTRSHEVTSHTVRYIEGIEVGKKLYYLVGDEIRDFIPYGYIVERNSIRVIPNHMYLNSRGFGKFLLKCNYICEEIKEGRSIPDYNHLHRMFSEVTINIPYKDLYESYDDALAARNDKIQKRIEEEIRKIDNV